MEIFTSMYKTGLKSRVRVQQKIKHDPTHKVHSSVVVWRVVRGKEPKTTKSLLGVGFSTLSQLFPFKKHTKMARGLETNPMSLKKLGMFSLERNM